MRLSPKYAKKECGGNVSDPGDRRRAGRARLRRLQLLLREEAGRGHERDAGDRRGHPRGRERLHQLRVQGPLSGRGCGRRHYGRGHELGERRSAGHRLDHVRLRGLCGHAHRHLRQRPRLQRGARHPQTGQDAAGRLPRRQRHGPVRGGLCPARPFHRLSDLRLRHGPAQRGELRLHHELDGRLLRALHHDHVRLRAGLLHRGHVQPRGRRHLHQGGGHGR